MPSILRLSGFAAGTSPFPSAVDCAGSANCPVTFRNSVSDIAERTPQAEQYSSQIFLRLYVKYLHMLSFAFDVPYQHIYLVVYDMSCPHKHHF